MMRRFRHSRGFATLVALALLGMVAAVTALLITNLRFAVMRTSLMPQDAQLRQLLLAGARDVAARARQWGAQPPRDSWSIQLPSDLADQHAGVTIHPSEAGADAVIVQVEARFDSRRAGESVRLNRGGARWKITGASLD
ncbi:MAG TPA: hypothetical protein VN541_22150 [Tepidisphaeraceae bacterium]|nr:hypothetical protein [Tepidisphaeraceae bacterium]